MKAFIDDFNLVRIESEDYLYDVNLLDEKLTFVRIENKFQYFESKGIIPLHKADRISINFNEYPLHIGLVTIKEDFNKRYRYDGVLGALYTKESTTFKIFSPVAKELYVVIDEQKYEMTYKMPIWEVEVKGNLLNKKYQYLIRISDHYDKVIDPYAIAGDETYSKIIDINLCENQKNSFIDFSNPEEAIIYEGHIRDLTVNLTVENKKNYLGLIEKSKELKKSVIEYLKDLGVTHLQLLPIQDFYEVDILNKDKVYNWGYNPKQYFVLISWYSNNPLDDYSKINEFKKVVDYAHNLGIGINLDVVYNHVYHRHLNPFDRIVPGYYYRHDENFKATNNSLVGNDLETTNYMVRKLIIDSLVYLTKTFKIDGFRFDLMGLLDIETMIEIENTLKEINPNIMLYGEGWNMVNTLPKPIRANMSNSDKFLNYAHFNDLYRNIMRGGNHLENERGYLLGNNLKLDKVADLLKGSKELFKNPKQSINFIECHDNHSFFDHMKLSGIRQEDLKIYQDFANHVLSISKGILFIHAGQELYRSKKMLSNTYNADDSVNGIVWKLPNSLLKFKEIIRIRKKYIVNSEKIDVLIKENSVIIEVDNKLRIYLKNDFMKSSVKENNIIFYSQDYNKPNGSYELLLPGVYIFEI